PDHPSAPLVDHPATATSTSSTSSSSSSVDAAEVSKFGAAAAEWWDSRGQFALLHRMNPARVGYVRDQALRNKAAAAESSSADTAAADNASAGVPHEALCGMRVLDIGCGGGFLSE
ncbi:hypothetical protein HK405_000831, partial [Cladochytrium tenue]